MAVTRLSPMLLLLLFALALGACNHDAVSPEQALPGRYTLRMVDDTVLPYPIFDVGTQKVEITAGDLQIDIDTTFTRSFTIQTTDNGLTNTYTQSDSGSWTIAGNQVTLTSSTNGSTDAGLLNGNQLTIISAGIPYVFKK